MLRKSPSRARLLIETMFEAAQLGRSLTKKQLEKLLPDLRARLVQAQSRLTAARVPVIIIISGVDGAGKGDVVHRLNEWFDPRGLDTHAFEHELDQKSERPRFWHFWQALPAQGRIALLFGSWYTAPVIRRVYGEIRKAELDQALDRIAFFEEMLAKDGALIIKLWFHLSKDALHERLTSLQRDPETHWRVLPKDWTHRKLSDKFIKVSERALRATDKGHSPWHLVEATDSRYRTLKRSGKLVTVTTEQLRKMIV